MDRTRAEKRESLRVLVREQAHALEVTIPTYIPTYLPTYMHAYILSTHIPEAPEPESCIGAAQICDVHLSLREGAGCRVHLIKSAGPRSPSAFVLQAFV